MTSESKEDQLKQNAEKAEEREADAVPEETPEEAEESEADAPQEETLEEAEESEADVPPEETPEEAEEREADAAPEETPEEAEEREADAAPEEAPEKKHRLRKCLLLILLIVACVYLAGVVYFHFCFYPQTTVNGVDCSFMPVRVSCERLEHVTDGYALTLLERDDETEQIAGEQIDYRVDPEETVRELLGGQISFDWVAHFFYPTEDSFEYTFLYDEDALEEQMETLDCLDAEKVTYPEDPKLSEYIEGSGYEILDPVIGTVVDPDALLENLQEAFDCMAKTLDLEEAGCYEEPDFSAETARLTKVTALLNRVVNTTITYEFGEEQVVLDGSSLHDWLIIQEDAATEEDGDETEDAAASEETEPTILTVEDLANDTDGTIDLDRVSVHVDTDKLAEFIADMADQYDTQYKDHLLTTHTGETVTVAGGNYGWLMNQSETLEELIGYLEAGEDYTGEAVYTQRAAQFDFPDYGDTYIEVSIDEQHFWYYQNGQLKLDSDLVSGKVSNGHSTPRGSFRIAYKARNQVLRGEDYATPVSFWMPFYNGCGLHDATWRSSFGGTIYQYGGSHGCLNLPYSVAKELYDYVEGGEAVLIY